VRTQVWVLRPDGTAARSIAGDADQHATLGPWTRLGHRVVVAVPPADADSVSRCDLVDPGTGEHEPVAKGGLVNVIDFSPDERFALLRDGKRGAHFCVTLDRDLDHDHPLLPYPETGSTEVGLLRPSVEVGGITAYLVTDAGRPRAALAAVALGPDGVRGEVGLLADREDAELELIDADDAGRLLILVWNVAGRSEVELLHPATGRRIAVSAVPGQVVTGCVLARHGETAVFSVEGPHAPSQLWRLDIADLTWHRLGEAPELPDVRLVEPTLETFQAHDGLELTGWLYRAPGATGPGPVALSLHGGPESQERPGFSPNHQVLAAAGITVFAPNIRGSSGFGRGFAHADDRYGRYDAIADVRSCVYFLVDRGIADPAAVAVTGRSYGGYLTLAVATRYPDLFAAAVDMCGMSDLLTFYRDTEPWIAAAAVTKYGDPDRDQALLEDLSPLRESGRITAPLLVVHGEHDTNVPIGEARQIVAAMEAGGQHVEYLELAGEGHEYRSRSARLMLIERLVAFLTTHLKGA
jgi:prolyl oligopeptidase PreP (S9A serine peptidase family)